MVVLYFVIAAYFVCVEAQMLRFGKCKDLVPQKEFDVKRYMGRWYQQERLFSLIETVGDCWVHEYFLDPEEGGKFNLEMRFNMNGRETSTGLNVYQQKKEDPAAFTSMFFNIPFTAQEYKVLATDYDAWAIEYRCQDHGVTSRRESLWILTRQPSPPKTILDSAHEYLNLIHFKTKSLGKVNQSCHVNNGHDEEDAEQAFRRQWLRSEIRAPRKPVNQTIRRIPSVSLEASTFHHTRVPTKNLIQDEMQNHKSNRPLVSKVTSAMLPFKMMKRRTDKEKKRGKLQTYDHSKVYNMTAENLLLITLLGAFV